MLAAAQMHRALQLFSQTIEDDETLMELADIQSSWESLVARGLICKAGTLCRHGINDVGDPQLYRFLQDYVPVAHYTPDSDPTHYKAVGLGKDGHPIWVQPTMREDSYRTGDIVWYEDTLWVCTSDYNVYAPGVHGWEEWNG